MLLPLVLVHVEGFETCLCLLVDQYLSFRYFEYYGVSCRVERIMVMLNTLVLFSESLEPLMGTMLF